MSLSTALNTAVASLKANQAAVQLVSGNVAHANDANYTRKTIALEAIVTGTDQGGSVGIAGYGNAVSLTLRKELELLTAASAGSAALNEYVTRIQGLFGSSTDQSGLAKLTDAFISAWQDFEAAPDSTITQGQVIAAGQSLATEVNQLAKGLDQIDTDIDRDLGNSVDKLNDLMDQLFQVNQKLQATRQGSAAVGNLADQRDKLVRDIAELVDVRRMDRADGSVALFTSSGSTLLDGPPTRLTYEDGVVTSPIDGSNAGALFRDGRIRALLDLRQENPPNAANGNSATGILRKLRGQLDMVVNAFTTNNGQPPSFAAAYDGAVGSLRISATPQTTVKATPALAQSTTIGLAGSLQTGDLFQITVGGRSVSYTATAADKSLDQIATKLAALINSDPNIGVTATAGAASLQLNGNTIGRTFSASSTVNGQLPELAAGLFAGTDRYTFAVNESLTNGDKQLKRNSGTAVIAALTATERSFLAPGLALSATGYSGLATGILSNQNALAKLVKDESDLDANTLDMTGGRYQSKVGVNLDEEIASLQVLQNAYSASARLLQAVQSLFDILDRIVAR